MKKIIKFTDLYKLIPEKKKIFSNIEKAIKNSNFVGGDIIKNFESRFSKFVGSKYCVTLGNGTDALEIAVKSLGLKKNSEIIIPVNTWISTAEAVVSNNFKLIFCDINLDDYSLNIDDLKKKINKKTGAVIPVHLYGYPSNMVEIKKICRKKKIKIIEDCAQAHGARIGKIHLGNFGDIGTFSFFPGKNLGAFGDGGAIVTNSKKIYEYALRLRNHGALKKYDHKFVARNSRLDCIQAIVLDLKLQNYKKVIYKRNKLAKIYFDQLSKISNLHLPKLQKKFTYAFHQYVIRLNNRDKLALFLKKRGIDTMIHYPYMLNELNFFPNGKSLNNSNKLGKKILSLPISEEHSEKDIYFISQKIKEFLNNEKK
tara:strand:+ start:675 stop:1781 length:1107 start_codon:yes stop_codon:yes gene_type:complete